MEVTDVNNVKIYNLSCGKTFPDWLPDRKKRQLLKKEPSLKRRIELIQDFEMPQLCNTINLSSNGEYIFACGVYKPTMRCYDLNNLSMKFERCFDSEIIKCKPLSDDYTKLVFMFCDRYVEFHSQSGRYYRLRIPKFGRDLDYHPPNCDLFFVGDTSDIIRLNLEKGQFLNPYQGSSTSFNCCKVNPFHHLLVCGSTDGQVEAWDPRIRERVGSLDCALSALTVDPQGIPAIRSIAFKDGVNLAVGTETGLVLLYDLRANKPYYTKDHMYGLPIKSVVFHQEWVISMDSKVVKIWDRETGKPFTSVQSQYDLNDLCLVPETGMFFLACENQKIQSFFIPSMGPAPKWCSFLDSIVEELEEDQDDAIYDDYKFVTTKDLEEIGLNHLIGTNLLRSYMHGFFIDHRLYNKAKATSNPFAYERYKKKKIAEAMEAASGDRVKLQPKLPKVNQELAKKLYDLELSGDGSRKAKQTVALLKDERFKSLFENEDFQIEQDD
ncbi:nucleolar protein 10-like [Panonychus citri]|uniref:nucleolar protein 10-like n=1 Tax=Panonychus citri TaxID=50023 RepID=UPI002307C54F|nr:nucleolar protein 10-like [Panonychus citri]